MEIEMESRRNKADTTEAADYLGVSPKTMAKWRCTGQVKIPYSKVGRCVRYSYEDLDHYLESHSVHKAMDAA